MISKEQLEQWIQMRERGMSFRSIAEHQDVGEAAVRYAIIGEMDRRRLAESLRARQIDGGCEKCRRN